jgi:PPM family protein phosphatase
MFAAIKQIKQVSGWCLDKGLLRENNEDYLSIVECSATGAEKDEFIGIYALADGMGGLEHGERASYTAVRAASQSLLQQAQNPHRKLDECLNWLKKAMHNAHMIQRVANARYDSYESGTTLVLALIVGNWLYVSNIGDSRAYLVSQKQMRQLSHDHSLAGMLVESGNLSKEEAAQSPFRHTLTQAIGLDVELEPTLVREQIWAGDYLLLCSDGLYSLLDEAEMLQIIQEAESPQFACEMLVDAANAAGGDDNIAVILVQIQES